MADTPDYFDRYENFALTKLGSGVLTLRFHSGSSRAERAREYKPPDPPAVTALLAALAEAAAAT
jgi:hypothetical protein